MGEGVRRAFILLSIFNACLAFSGRPLHTATSWTGTDKWAVEVIGA